MKHWVYILHSEKLNRFYTGETADFDIRITFHENPEARKFTAKAKDWKLFLKIECRTKQQGLKIEAHIKRMKSSTYIKNLKKYPEIIQKLQLVTKADPDPYSKMGNIAIVPKLCIRKPLAYI